MLTQERWAELAALNRDVNRRIEERSDLETTGMKDEWRLPRDGVGDCEDFAIMKKHELMKRGWPASSLLLTVARNGQEGHAVLTVRTRQGGFVLDNRSSRVLDWTRTDYRYFARQSIGDGARWTRIQAPTHR